ncbi:unnamed protein product, partial [Rotaria sp. Silwood2]
WVLNLWTAAAHPDDRAIQAAEQNNTINIFNLTLNSLLESDSDSESD